MTNIAKIENIVLEEISLSRDETHHIYNEIPFYTSRFDLVMSFHPPGIAAVRDKTGAYHINLRGKPLYQKRFLESYGFYGDNAAVCDKFGWFHIDMDGNPHYDERYEWVGNFQDKRCPVRDKDGYYLHIKPDGALAYNNKYKYVGDFKYGIAVVYDNSGYAQHIDKMGNSINKKKFTELGVFHKGCATAKDTRGAFHINKQGNELYNERYGWVEPFYNGLAFTCKKNGEKLIINQSGDVIQEIYNQKSLNVQHLLKNNLMGMLVGYWKTQIIHSIVELEILDLIRNGNDTFEKLLVASLLPNESLKLVIQVLKIWNFIKEFEGIYILRYLGELLTEDNPQSLKYASLMWGDEHYLTMSKLTYALKQYKPQFQEIFGQSLFDYFNSHSEKGLIYNNAMKAYSLDYDKVVDLYDFSSTKVIMDVGGGIGCLLEKILTNNSHIEKGILFELTSVTEHAKNEIISNSIKQKVEFVSGNFLEEIHPRADTIVISRILHDWDDETAIKILKNIHDALEHDGQLLIFEMVIPEDPEHDIGVSLNFNLLVNVGGKERTNQEFENIFKIAGFGIRSIKRREGVISMIVVEKLKKK